QIVTADGKVDYERLAERRALLARTIELLGLASPDTHPARFPGEEHVLAYWINAYNAFVLDAVIAEYPIRSVWKVRDGQFFERARARGGGPPLTPDRDRPPPPAGPLQRPPHPLRDQLRLERLPADAPRGLPARGHPRHPPRGDPAVPRQRVELSHRPRGAP